MISAKELEQIDYLLDQSARGFHLLFDSHAIRNILSTPTESLDFFTLENVNKIQKLLNDFLKKTTFEEKQVFLEKLDTETYELLVRTYFNIVDNAILESTKLKH